MKILDLERRAGEALMAPPALTVIPDSAIVPGIQPMFLSDCSPSWAARLCLAFRINRLGKNIGRRFANRYYDAVTVALRAIPSEMELELARRGVSTGLAGAVDSTLAIGQWLPVSEVQAPYIISGPGIDSSVTAKDADIDSAVNIISRYMTMRTGDIILACSPQAPDTALTPGTSVDAHLCGTHVLHLKIR